MHIEGESYFKMYRLHRDEIDVGTSKKRKKKLESKEETGVLDLRKGHWEAKPLLHFQ